MLDSLAVLHRKPLRTRHLFGISEVTLSCDLEGTVPAVVGALFAMYRNSDVLIPPFAIPEITVKHYWHRSRRSVAGNKWLRSVLVQLCVDINSVN